MEKFFKALIKILFAYFTFNQVDMFLIINFILLLFASISFGAIRKDEKYKWPKTGIRVNYYWNSWYLDKAIANLEANTCLRFKREYDYYGIKDDNGLEFFWTDYCYVDHVGKKEKKESNKIYVSKHCMYDVTKIEALMLQALGLLTEYSREDRDNYTVITKENINPKYESYFYLNSKDNASTYGTPYDYGSVLHDDSKAFSLNNKNTLEVKEQKHKEFYQKMLGQ
uniref:Metalloendopeptidase n=1 Tax=Parastrongyloides trichosuri TaxID=131310 RepID=A0A0N4ZII5_PARTI